jgi:hypothetical protein
MKIKKTNDEYMREVLAKVKQDANGCWIWKGRVGPWGYGYFSFAKETSAHRIMYALIHGPIPKGMRVCHTCDVRLCCNPGHLWLGTQQENIRDCSQKKRHTNGAKAVCKHGHEFTPENTLMADAGKGRWRRQCKLCNRYRQRIAAGWTPEQAATVAASKRGYRPVGGSWVHARKSI